MGNGISVDEARRMGLLPKRAEPLKPLSAEQLRKAGDAATAVRLREAEDAKKKRDAALKRDHTRKCEIRVIGPAPSINKLTGGKLKHRMTIKADYQERCREAWERAGRPVIQSPYKLAVRIVVSSPECDPSNLYQGAVKCFLDAAQWCGCIAQDDWKAHKGPDRYSWEHRDYDLVSFMIESLAPKGEF